MKSLIEESPDAEAWVDITIALHDARGLYARVLGSVIWSDLRDDSGSIILPFDPADVVAKVNEQPLPLQREHDPGRPLGKVLEAAQFQTTDGRRFVAAILGFYDSAHVVAFDAFGIDHSGASPRPSSLPDLPAGFRLAVEADPKEVSPLVMADLVKDLGVPVEVEQRSHNSAEAPQQLLVIGVAFSLLVWNPFVKTIGQEAGKDAYRLARDGLRSLLERAGVLDNPLVEIQATLGDCPVSFLIRGKETERHLKANASIEAVALRAHNLVERFRAGGVTPIRVVYEFGKDDLWAPSFVELDDGRLVSDNLALIAVETLPTALSLGLTVQERLED